MERGGGQKAASHWPTEVSEPGWGEGGGERVFGLFLPPSSQREVFNFSLPRELNAWIEQRKNKYLISTNSLVSDIQDQGF